jgi:hypothetical protein
MRERMTLNSKAAGANDDASLREIESLVAAVPLEAPPATGPSPDEPDIEQVARDLGISVEEAQALRYASLG